MQHKLSRILLALGSALLFSTAGLLLAGKSEARPAPAACAPNEETSTIYYRTTAQLEPVGGSISPGCDFSFPNVAWGSISPYYSMTCSPNANCE